MSKGLEALKRVHELIVFECGSYYENNYEEIKIIEKELKALEIIFKKFVSPQDFILCNYTLNDKKWLSYEEYKKAYMKYYEDDKYLLLEEEYDLLKEVLS